MASALCFSPLISSSAIDRPGIVSHTCTGRKVNWIIIDNASRRNKTVAFEALKVHAADKKSGTKVNSILCADCEGNGAKTCAQCEGTGVNIVDHFNGQFKAGGSCWLCRGKKEVLCGNCNGAGFMGGFMSTYDD